MSLEDIHSIQSDKRKNRMFAAIDEAFAKVNQEFDNEENSPSFQEMYDAISMLDYKVHRLEMDAYITYRLIEHKEKPSNNIGIQ